MAMHPESYYCPPTLRELDVPGFKWIASLADDIDSEVESEEEYSTDSDPEVESLTEQDLRNLYASYKKLFPIEYIFERDEEDRFRLFKKNILHPRPHPSGRDRYGRYGSNCMGCADLTTYEMVAMVEMGKIPFLYDMLFPYCSISVSDLKLLMKLYKIDSDQGTNPEGTDYNIDSDQGTNPEVENEEKEDATDSVPKVASLAE